MKGYKTIIFNAAIAAATAFIAHFDPTTIGEIAGSYGPYVLIGVNVINMLLRAGTNTPIGKKA